MSRPEHGRFTALLLAVALVFGAASACRAADPPLTSAKPLPIPPGPADLPRPTGSAADLRVLPWAGFKGAVSYSFDDSQPSQIEHWAQLAATGVPMTAYINAINRDKTPNYDAAWRAVGRAGWELGNHTVHHCYFGKTCEGLTRFDAAAEIDDDRDFISGVLGAPGVWTLAYPYGDLGYEAEAPRHVFLARGVMPGAVDPHGGDAFNLPIYGAKTGDTAAQLNPPLDAARDRGQWLIYMFHSITPTAQVWYAPVDISQIVATVDHAKAFGDLWMDTLLNIGAYWRGETTIEAATSSSAKTPQPITWTWTLPAHFPPGHRLRVTVDGGALSQNGREIAWNGHGYYEIDLDAGSLSWRP